MRTKSLFSVLFLALCLTLTAQQYDPGSGKTVLLIGQTWQQEFQDYVSGVKPPAGSSHYGEIYSGEINQGNDAFGNGFLTYMNNTYPGAYALIAISIKDNPGAGGFGDTYSALQAINSGNLDTQIDKIAQTFADHSNLKFYVRLGYEVSLYMFAPGGDTQAYINAYNRMAKRIRAIAKNVDFVYHPVRGFNDTRDLYPGDEYVDFVGFSVFNNDICLECNGTFNCQGSQVDPNLQQSMDFAKQKGKPIIIAESAVQSPAAASVSGFNDYLDRLFAVVENNDVRALAYINSDWNSHGWGPEWGDSRVEKNSAVLSHWNSYVNKPRYIHYNGSTAPSCSDGIKNQGETGIDCGGPCPACTNGPTCSDGIQNGDEEGVDCGGSCPNSCGTSGTCKEFGVSYVNDNTIRVYHKDNGWSAQWQYVCLDGYCVAGEKKDGYYYKDFKAALGQQYTIQFKAEDNATGQYLSPEEKVTFTKEKCSFVVNDADPTCTDGIQNGGETGVDCGGPCPACTTGPTCSDGIQNGDETGIDCGGSCPNSCAAVGEGNCGEFGISHVNDNTVRVYHKDNGWSASWQYVCLDGYCVTGEKKDGYYYKDFDATLGQQYEIQFKAEDNATGQYLSPVEKVTFTKDKCSFTGGTEPTCTDGIQNGDETGIDCGGSCPACSTEPTCNDGIQNGNETGVDCGGSCPACTTEPTCYDGIQNGDETGVDCGGSCAPCGGGDYITGKFSPKDKKALLIIGQDMGSVNGYKNSGHFPEMGGVTQYTDIYSLAGLTSTTNYGAGDICLQCAVDQNPNSTLSVGLYMVEGVNQGVDYSNGLTDLVNGRYDEQIRRLGQFAIDNAPTPIYMRIGYEFDGNWNHYDANRYKAAYRYMVDKWRAMGVKNMAYVWQSATWGADDPNLMPNWYPGDNYVDYVGVSFFFYDAGFNGDNLKYALDFARGKNKPVMMAEVSAQYYEFDQQTYHWVNNGASLQGVHMSSEEMWNQFFVDQLLPFVYENDDIVRIVAYINCDWQSQPQWKFPDANNGFWGDTRIEANSYITSQWKKEIANGRWLHGGPSLNSQLVGAGKSTELDKNALSAKSVAAEKSFIVYPNPTKGELTILGLDKTGSYTIYNFAGTAVVTDNKTTKDITNLPAGMYFIKSSTNQVVTFIKE